VSAVLRCPVCRAQLEQGPQCRRCRADLSLLFTLRDQCERALQTAYACVARGQLGEAREMAEEVEAMRQDEESRRLRVLLHLLSGEFEQAWNSYRERGADTSL
jgi:hypothetical protein